MGMSNYIMDLEEQFFEAASDVAHECETFDIFCDLMMKQRDLVVHMDMDEVVDILGEIYSGN